MSGAYASEVSFAAAPGRLVAALHAEGGKGATTVAAHHPLNHKISVCLPQCGAWPAGLADPGAGGACATAVLQTQLGHLVCHVPFLDKILGSGGEFVAFSHGRHSDEEDVVAICNGALVMDVGQDTYEQLGLEGKRRHLQHDRYVVRVELCGPDFRPGKPRFERVAWCLTDRLGLDFTLVMALHLPGGSALALLQDALPDARPLSTVASDPQVCALVLVALPAALTRGVAFGQLLEDHPLPDLLQLLGEAHRRGAVEAQEAAGVMEWVGLTEMGIRPPADEFLNHYTPLEPSAQGRCLQRSWTGLFPIASVLALLAALRTWVQGPANAKGDQVPWAVLLVSGFQDSPVSWRDHEHGFQASGNNDHAIVVFRSGPEISLCAISGHDTYA